MVKIIALIALTALIGLSLGCSDRDRRCPYLASRGYCKRLYVNYMRAYCKKSCGLCIGGSSSCGRSNVLQPRIIAGVDAKPGAWPWMASLWVNRRTHLCGGSLLNARWILTAGHCVVGTGASTRNLQIKLGEHNHYIRDGSEQIIDVEKIIPHPRYTLAPLRHDIALIKLRRPAMMNSRVQTICLPAKGSRPTVGSRQCYLSGWGSIQHPGSFHHTLQQAMLPVVSYTKCFNRRDMICTGFGRSKLTNACRGDSGGPYMCRKSDGSWVQYGVASFVIEYCKYYTAFTPVGDYIDWINRYIRS